MSYKFWVAINLSTKNYRGWRAGGGVRMVNQHSLKI